MLINARFLTKRITGLERYAIGVSLRLKTMSPESEFIAPRDILHKEHARTLAVKTVGYSAGHVWEQTELPVYLAANKAPLLLGLTNTGPLTYPNQVVVIHDLAFLREPGWFSKKAALSFKYLVSGVAKIARHIITNSEFTKKEVIDLLGISPDKISVAYPAVPENIRRLTATQHENKYGDYILTLSSLDPRKNLKSLIRAYRQLGLRDVKLVVAGGENQDVFGKHAFELRAITKEDTNILFTGYLSDDQIVGLYQNARLFVYPSLYEGFGFPPLEAMACGCPVVASNSSSLPEALGSAASYADTKNIDELAGTISKVLNEPRIAHAEARTEQVQKFSWEKTATAILSAVQAVEKSQ
jgi:glycosyltransferase involved in cell wall biosynthesis